MLTWETSKPRRAHPVEPRTAPSPPARESNFTSKPDETLFEAHPKGLSWICSDDGDHEFRKGSAAAIDPKCDHAHALLSDEKQTRNEATEATPVPPPPTNNTAILASPPND